MTTENSRANAQTDDNIAALNWAIAQAAKDCDGVHWRSLMSLRKALIAASPVERPAAAPWRGACEHTTANTACRICREKHGEDFDQRSAPSPAEGKIDSHVAAIMERDALAHEVWSAAQRAPGEGIEDAVQRIAAILSRSPAMAAEAVAISTSHRVLDLKTDPDVFAAVLFGKKTHEIRFNDRGFVVGDVLRLRETRYAGQEMRGPEPKPLEYTGRETIRAVSHVLEGYGLQPGWVILSFAPEPSASAGVVAAARAVIEALADCLKIIDENRKRIGYEPGSPNDKTVRTARALLAAHDRT